MEANSGVFRFTWKQLVESDFMSLEKLIFMSI